MSNWHDHEQRAFELQQEYIDVVAAKLRPELSPLELADTLKELRAHLQASTAAYQELGLEPPEAASAAISKLGDPAHIGRGLAKEAAHPFFRPLVVAAGMAGGSLMMIAMDAIRFYWLLGLFGPYRPSPWIALAGSVFGLLVGLCAVPRRVGPLAFVFLSGIGLPAIVLASNSAAAFLLRSGQVDWSNVWTSPLEFAAQCVGGATLACLVLTLARPSNRLFPRRQWVR